MSATDAGIGGNPSALTLSGTDKNAGAGAPGTFEAPCGAEPCARSPGPIESAASTRPMAREKWGMNTRRGARGSDSHYSANSGPSFCVQRSV